MKLSAAKKCFRKAKALGFHRQRETGSWVVYFDLPYGYKAQHRLSDYDVLSSRVDIRHIRDAVYRKYQHQAHEAYVKKQTYNKS